MESGLALCFAPAEGIAQDSRAHAIDDRIAALEIFNRG